MTDWETGEFLTKLNFYFLLFIFFVSFYIFVWVYPTFCPLVEIAKLFFSTSPASMWTTNCDFFYFSPGSRRAKWMTSIQNKNRLVYTFLIIHPSENYSSALALMMAGKMANTAYNERRRPRRRKIYAKLQVPTKLKVYGTNIRSWMSETTFAFVVETEK